MSDEIEALRARVDELDATWIEVLARRFEVTREIGRHKAALANPARDADREARQRARITATAEAHGIDPALARSILQAIVDTVVAEHREAGAR